MTIRYYILPMDSIPNPATGGNSHGPKYIQWSTNPPVAIHDGLDVPWGGFYYGLKIPAMLIAADVTQEQHEQLAAEIDVAAAPVSLDENVSTLAIPKVQSVLEALMIPAEWVDETYTYRQLLRMVAGLFQFASGYWGQWRERLIDNPAQLDLRWNQIPTERQDRIKATADGFGWDYSDVTNTWLIRQILKHLADQWGDKPFSHQLGVL